MTDDLFQLLTRHTNKRQAAKICDTSSPAALYLNQGLQDWYVRNTDSGIWTVGYKSGAMYLSRCISPELLATNIAAADGIDVLHDRDELPEAVVSPPGRLWDGDSA
jgi:hypothetical protein